MHLQVGTLLLALMVCSPPSGRTGSRGAPPPLDGSQAAASSATLAAEVVRARGTWRAIPRAPAAPPDHEPARGLAVGHALLVHHPSAAWLASYDPCTGQWRQHEPLPQGLRSAAPLALDSSRAAFCCGPPDRAGALVDLAAARSSAIAPMPQTPYPGRTSQVLAGGILVPTDKRYDASRGAWRVLPFDASIQEATGQQGSAIASSGAHVLFWSGEREGRLFEGGAVFDAARDAWRPVARAGAPAPRRDALAIWTGRDFLVFGGSTVGGDSRDDGARYEPAGDRWQAVARGPHLEGPLAATVSGDTVLVWGPERGGAYDTRTDRWRDFALPARVPVQDRPHGHGRLAVITASDAFVLDPERLRWARTELPRAVRGRGRRVQQMTATHLLLWGGETPRSSGGCEDPPTDEGCDPVVETRTEYDGAALALASCR